MVSLSTWFRYAAHKFEYSISLSWKKYNVGQINSTELTDAIWKNFFQGKLTYTHWTKGGEAMAPIVSPTGGTLLVRKLANLSPTQVFVGDVVLLKDPEKSDDLIIRRLAALEGYEMVSNDEKDEPFVLEKDQCWVVADNLALKPKEARDSRLFGPVPMTDILGRVIYSLRTAVDHGPVENRFVPVLYPSVHLISFETYTAHKLNVCSYCLCNSGMALKQDGPVLAVELDVEEMAKNNKA
ncbi:unnamed protein product [Miscanthus lutarioriparius]|uniref:Peptidase S24/S26A/S26B/S26C family protein n=1 Tax=Miscanthus lutarioriparius TaxID=422564 RepID=A0A811R370_9POAL|nr:unnamed protein product [Miscanthus lutarioriparius]